MKRDIQQSVFDAFHPMAKRICAEVGRKLDNTPRHMLDVGNPNHPSYDLHLFGEHHEDFIKRQYK